MVDKACPYCAETIKVEAIKCRFCGSALDVQPVPKPTSALKPPPKSTLVRGVKRVVITLVGIFGVLTVIGMAINLSKKPGASGASETSVGSTVLDVSSDQLHKDYNANEISADELYRGKPLRVTGAVQSINKDFMDHPYIVLWTTNQFQGIHARFTDAAGLSGLSAGTRITALCVGSGKTIGSPTLRDCVLE